MTPQSRLDIMSLRAGSIPLYPPTTPQEVIAEPGFFPGLVQSLSQAYLTLIQWSSRALYKSVPIAMTPTEEPFWASRPWLPLTCKG